MTATARGRLRGALLLTPLVLMLLALAACGGEAAAPAPAPTPEATATAPPTATPATPVATATPAWWERETATPDPGPPQSRVWNLRVEARSADEVAVTFDYHLDIAPEANVFVHMGLLPDVNVALLDADGEALARVGGELDPTEFGNDTVGGRATFILATGRFEAIAGAHICIRVVTGNYDDFAGRSEVFCEPVPVEAVEGREG